VLVGLASIIIGIFFSPVLQTLGVFVIAGNAILHKELYTHIRVFMQSKYLWCYSLIVLVYMISGLWSQDTSYYVQRTLSKLPLLFLPLGYTAWKSIHKREIICLMYLCILLSCAAVCYSLFYFIQYNTYYEQQYRMAKVLPTWINHIRMSVFFAIVIIWCIYAYFNDVKINYKWEKYIYLIAGILLFIGLHILAVRSGLLCLYTAIMSYLIWHAIRFHYYYLLGFILIVPFIFGISYTMIPTFKSKLDYTIYDWKLFGSKLELQNISDGQRIMSYRGAWEIIKSKPWHGTGAGDIKIEVHKATQALYPQVTQTPKDPHNQFIYWLTAFGIIGGILCTWSIYYSYFALRLYLHPLPLSFIVIFTVSCMVEASLETQLGISIYIIFTLLWLKWTQLTNSSYTN